MNHKPITVLVVDDSRVSRDLLSHLYNSDPDLHVVGSVCDGKEALEFIERLQPDVISMDVQMPRMDGYETTRAIMASHPMPIVMVTSSLSRHEMQTSFAALDAGALAVVSKPHGPGHPDHAAASARVVNTMKAMSEVKVVRRRQNAAKAANGRPDAAAAFPPQSAPRSGHRRIVVVGVSTGGPPVLHTILDAMPRDFPLPVVIVQHISAGFLEGMCAWLKQTTGQRVSLAAGGEMPQPGCIYFAPDDSHLEFDSKGRFLLNKEPPANGLRPSVAHLFRSAALVFGDAAVGVLLTGMGRDGADELKVMRDKGAVTIAQDKESSVVHGMPGEAIALNAAQYILPPDGIVALLTRLVKPSTPNGT